MRICFLIVSLIYLAACQSSRSDLYSIEGAVLGYHHGVVYLQDHVDGEWVDVDSTNIINGVFYFTGRVEYPQLRSISVSGIENKFLVFIENTDILVAIDSRVPSEYLVRGSASHNILRESKYLSELFDNELEEIQKIIRRLKAEQNHDQLEEYYLKYLDVARQKDLAIRDFVIQHKDKTVGVFIATTILANKMNSEELTELLIAFDPALKNTQYVDKLITRAARLSLLEKGRTAPEFEMSGINGEPIFLRDFRGKYLLLSFRDAGYPNKKQNNPFLRELYGRYHDHNFEILAVSPYRDQAALLEGISEEDIPWPQISNLKGWEISSSDIYALASIPSNVLIDPSGKIIGRNLEMFELERMLLEIFGY
jgi:peroxiredoxin